MPFDLRTFSLKSPTVAAIDLQTVAQLRSFFGGFGVFFPSGSFWFHKSEKRNGRGNFTVASPAKCHRRTGRVGRRMRWKGEEGVREQSEQSLIILKSPPSTAQIAHICHITATLTRTSAEPEDWAELK